MRAFQIPSNKKDAAEEKLLSAAPKLDSSRMWFSLQLGGRPAAQKKFIDVLTRVVAKKAEPTECQKCDCQVDRAGVGMSVCRDCNFGNVFYDVSVA